MRRTLLVALLSLSTPVAADETETEVDLGHFGLWPDVALGADGVLHLVYTRCATPDGPTGCAVRYRRWEGGGWGAEETVPDSTTVSRAETNRARVAVDDAGRVHVAWGPAIQLDTAVLYARRAADGTWGPRETVTEDQVEALDLEVLGDTVVIAANKIDPAETRVYTRAAGGAGGFAAQLLGDVGKDVTLYRACGAGHLLLSWWWVSRFVGFRLYSFDGSWSGETQVRELPEDSPSRPALVEDAAGGVSLGFTAWRRLTATEYEPVAVFVREPDGATVQLSAAALGPTSDPSLGADALGSRYAVWADAAGQLRFTNHLWWRPEWIPEGVFPTFTTVEQVTMVVGGLDTHLVWRDDAGHLRHNHRLARDDDAQLVDDTIPAALAPGATVTATVRLRNSGNLPWPAGGAWALGAVDDADPLSAATRVALPAEVAAGAEVELTITLIAPATEGSVVTDWRMVREGAYWFGDTLSRTVDVVAAPPAPDAGAGPDAAGGGGDDEGASGGCGCRAAPRSGQGGVGLVLVAVAAWITRGRGRRR